MDNIATITVLKMKMVTDTGFSGQDIMMTRTFSGFCTGTLLNITDLCEPGSPTFDIGSSTLDIFCLYK